MNYTEHLLVKLAEESSELAKEATQAALFGLDSKNPVSGQTGRQRILDELNDLMGIVRMLETAGLIPHCWQDLDKQDDKVIRVSGLMEHARKIGSLKR